METSSLLITSNSCLNLSGINQKIKNQKNIFSQNFSQEMIKSLLSKGFTQQNIAVSLKASKSTISNILTGKIKKVRPEIFSNLLQFYCANYLLRI